MALFINEKKYYHVLRHPYNISIFIAIFNKQITEERYFWMISISERNRHNEMFMAHWDYNKFDVPVEFILEI